jgi:hypothetical protein
MHRRKGGDVMCFTVNENDLKKLIDFPLSHKLAAQVTVHEHRLMR